MSISSNNDQNLYVLGNEIISSPWKRATGTSDRVNNHWTLAVQPEYGSFDVGFVDMGLHNPTAWAINQDWLTIAADGYFALNISGVEYLDANPANSVNLEVVGKQGFTTDGSFRSVKVNVGNHQLDYVTATVDSTLFTGSGWDKLRLQDNPYIADDQFWTLIRRQDGEIDAYNLYTGKFVRVQGGTTTWGTTNNLMNYGELESISAPSRWRGTDEWLPGRDLSNTGDRGSFDNIDLYNNTYANADTFNAASFGSINFTTRYLYTGQATVEIYVNDNTQGRQSEALTLTTNGTKDLMIFQQAVALDGHLRLYVRDANSGLYNRFNEVFIGSSSANSDSNTGSTTSLNGTATVIPHTAMYGFDGNDVLTAGIGDDYLFGGSSTYSTISIAGNAGNILQGGDGQDRFGVGNISGGANSDAIMTTNFTARLSGVVPSGADAGAVTSRTLAGADLTAELATRVATDRINDWTQGVDYLRVLANATAIIEGLGTANGAVGAYVVDTIGADAERIDVSGSRVVNDGKIVLRGLAGNDTLVGSTGNDYIYGNDNANLITLDNGGSDRVYFDGFFGKPYVSGFDASNNDLFFLNKRVIDALGGNTARAMSASDNLTSGGQSYTASVAFNPGINFLYDAFYGPDGSLPSNQQHTNGPGFADGSDNYADTSTIIIGAGMIAVGIALSWIPGAGAALIAAGSALGGAAAVGSVLVGTQQHQHAVYTGNVADEYLNVLTAQTVVNSTAATTVNANIDNFAFLDFFASANAGDGFTPAIQFSNVTGGVYGYFAVHSDEETFVYLVASNDNIVTNGETVKVAEINGTLLADDFKIYDGEADIYNYGTIAPLVVMTPAVTGVVFDDTDNNPADINIANGDRVVTSGDGTFKVSGSFFAANQIVGNALTTTNASSTVVVNATAHGLSNGALVMIDGATSSNGVDFNGTYAITLIDANRFSFTAIHFVDGADALEVDSVADVTAGVGLGGSSIRISTVANVSSSSTYDVYDGTTLLADNVAATGSSFLYTDTRSIGTSLTQTPNGTVTYDSGQTRYEDGTGNQAGFSIVNTSSIVTVDYTSHGLQVGDSIQIVGATAAGGINFNGTWVVATAPTANRFTFVAANNASSTITNVASEFSYSLLSTAVVRTTDFATTAASTAVTVTLVDHGMLTGDRITFNAAETINGVSFAAGTAYPVTKLTNNTFSIIGTNNAASTAAGLAPAVDATATLAVPNYGDQTFFLKDQKVDYTITLTNGDTGLETQSLQYSFTAGGGTTTLNGGGGTDALILGEENTTLNTLSDNRLVNIEKVQLTSGATAAPITLDLHLQSDGFEIVETDGSNTIIGSTGNDTIYMLAGVDNVNGQVGNDLIIFRGTTLTDADTVNGGTGTDQVRVDLSATVNFTLDSDFSDIDTLTLNDIDAAGYDATVTLAASYSNASMTVDASSLDTGELLNFNASAVVAGNVLNIFGGADSDTIQGGADADTITGNAGADSLVGGSGSDVFVLAADTDITGTETINGGMGDTDVIRLDATGAYDFTAGSDVISNIERVAVNTYATMTITLTDNFNSDTANVEIINGTGGAITNAININASAFTGGAGAINVSATNFNGADTMTGGVGADTINGGAGADTIIGNAGADSLVGGLGADVFVYAANDQDVAAETINGTSEQATDDAIRLDASGAYDFTGFANISNVDLLSVNADTAATTITLVDGVVGTADANNNGTLGDFEIIDATPGTSNTNAVHIIASALTGTNAINVSATTFAGNDTMTGGAGADTINGGAGNDTITGNAGADSLVGGLGADVFVYAANDQDVAAETINGTSEQATDDAIRLDASGAYDFTGFANISNVDLLSVNADTAATTITLVDGVVGTADANNNGTLGDFEIIDATPGTSNTNAVHIIASALTGTNAINVSATTFAGNDTMTGGAGADTINGGAGNDTITGNAGVDSLDGGDGIDTFLFGSGALLAQDSTIKGGNGNDIIEITAADLTLVNGNFTNVDSVEVLTLTGASTVELGADATQAGVTTVNTGAGATSVTRSDTTATTVDAASLLNDVLLTIDDSGVTANFTVTNLIGDLDASGLAGTLNATLIDNTNDSDFSITLSDQNATITGGVADDTLNITQTDNPQNVGIQVVDLTGNASTVNITFAGGQQTIKAGTGIYTINTGIGSATGEDRVEFLAANSADVPTDLTANDATLISQMSSISQYNGGAIDFIGTDTMGANLTLGTFATDANGVVTNFGVATTDLGDKIAAVRNVLDQYGAINGSSDNRVVIFTHQQSGTTRTDTYAYGTGTFAGGDDQIIRIVDDSLNQITTGSSFMLNVAVPTSAVTTSTSLLPSIQTWYDSSATSSTPSGFTPGNDGNATAGGDAVNGNTNQLIRNSSGNFGTQQGGGDDYYTEITVPTGSWSSGLNMFGTNYTKLYMGSNGYVTFGSGYWGYVPSGIDTYTRSPMIAAQFDDLYTNAGARKIADGAGSGTSSNTHKMYYYETSDMMVFTWDNVGLFSNGVSDSQTSASDKGSAFQIIIHKLNGEIAASTNFGIEIRYEEVTQQYASATAGWTAGDRLNFSLINPSKTNLYQTAFSSNVGINGVWGWEVLGGQITTATFLPDVGLTAIENTNDINVRGITAASYQWGGEAADQFIVASTGANVARVSTIVNATFNLWKDQYVDNVATVTVTPRAADNTPGDTETINIDLVRNLDGDSVPGNADKAVRTAGSNTITVAAGGSMVDAFDADLGQAIVVGANTYNQITTITATGSGSTINIAHQSENYTLNGNSGVDSITAGSGNDTIVGGGGVDSIQGNGGDDSISMQVNAGNLDSIAAGTTGETNGDTLVLTGAAAGNVTVNLAAAAGGDQFTDGVDALTQSDFENVNASSMTGAALIATATAAGSVITGSASNDTLNGGNGIDTLSGGSGNDSITGGTGADSIVGESGDDRITMLVSAGNLDTIAAGTTGETAGDTLVLTGAAAGNVTVNLSVASGSDQFTDSVDVLQQSDFDHIDASAMTGFGLIATARSVGSSMTGTAQDDTLNGGIGNDSINGWSGNDTATGGNGIDTFTVNQANAHLTITDLGVGIDNVMLNNTNSSSVTATLGASFTATSNTWSRSGSNADFNINTNGYSLNLASTANANVNSAGFTVNITGAVAATYTGSRLSDVYVYTSNPTSGDAIVDAADSVSTADTLFLNGTNIDISTGLTVTFNGASYAGIEQLVIKSGETATLGATQLAGKTVNIAEDTDGGNTTLNISGATGTQSFANLTFTSGITSQGGQTYNAFDNGSDKVVINVDSNGTNNITGTSIGDVIVAGTQGGTLVIDGGNGTDELRATSDLTLTGWTSVENLSLQGDGTDVTATTTVFNTSGLTSITGTAPGASMEYLKISGGNTGEVIDVHSITFTDAAVSITGGTGNDTITGGNAADFLAGGAGSDVFVYTSNNETTQSNVVVNMDVITDFNVADDLLDLSAFNLSAGPTATVDPLDNDSYVVSWTAAGVTNYIYLQNTGVTGGINWTNNSGVYTPSAATATGLALTLLSVNSTGFNVTGDGPFRAYFTDNTPVRTDTTTYWTKSTNVGASTPYTYSLADIDPNTGVRRGYITIQSTNTGLNTTYDGVVYLGGADNVGESITAVLTDVLPGSSNTPDLAIIYAQGGDDTITGTSGNDSIFGGAGNDTVTGGVGVDYFGVDAGIDTITDLGGTNTNLGANEADVLVVSAGATANVTVTDDWIATADTQNNGGTVTLTFAALDAQTIVDVPTRTMSPDGVDVDLSLAGGSAGYTIDARPTSVVATWTDGSSVIHYANNTITGSAFADTIYGGARGDIINGGLGNDTYIYGATITDSAVTSTVSAPTGWDTVTVSVGDIFDFNAAVAAKVNGVLSAGVGVAVNGTGFITQLNTLFQSGDDGLSNVEAAVITFTDGVFLVVDSNSDQLITANDNVVKLVGTVTGISIVSDNIVIA